MLEHRADYLEEWKIVSKGDDLLKAYRATQMIELTRGKPIKKIDFLLVAKVLDHCVVKSKVAIDFHFLNGDVVNIQ